MLDLDSLDWQMFEALAVLLLRREGYELSATGSDRGRDNGVDALGAAPDGARTAVIVKHIRGQGGMSHAARHAVVVAEGLRVQFPDYQVLFVASRELPPPTMSLLEENKIRWLGRADLDLLLEKYPEVAEAVQAKANAADLSNLFAQPEDGTALSFEQQVTERLAAVTLGKTGWKEYEKVAAGVLTEIFAQHLNPPTLQIRSDDGLDIMDAIFDIPDEGSAWERIRADYRTYFVVAEFKNYTDQIGQKSVNQLADYLWVDAFRMFGLLISRKRPKQSAADARRRVWLKERKLIAFLADEDLIEMARRVDEGKNPYGVIREQLIEFFRTLAP